mgnify:CR=1 FL=1
MRAAYCIVKIVIIALVMVVEFGPELASGDKYDQLVDSKQFALINFSVNIGSTILAVIVNIYLICMGLKMQHVPRKYEHVKGYKGELLIAVLYLLHLIMTFYWHIL